MLPNTQPNLQLATFQSESNDISENTMTGIAEPIAGFDSQVSNDAVTQLYLNDKAADVYFVLTSGERVPAHKNLLVTASTVFDTMFYGSVPEVGDVRIVDASAAAFKEFLQFFYFNKVHLTMANIGDVTNLCNKYDVAMCLEICKNFLKSNLTADNVCKIYGLAIVYDRLNLKDICEEEITNHTKMVFKSLDYLDCCRKVLEHILKLDVLSCSEVDVFEASMSWIKHVSQTDALTREIVQRCMGDLFYAIRFRSMTNDEFVNLLPTYGKLFIGEDFNEILQMIKNKEFQPKMFNGSKRVLHFEWKNKSVINCNRYLGRVDELCAIEYVEITKLTTNEEFLLSSFVCPPIFGENGQPFRERVPANVTIITALEGKASQNGVAELSHRGFTSYKLSKPVLLHADVEYKVRFDLAHPVWCGALMEVNDTIVIFDQVSDTKSDKKGLHIYVARRS